LQTLEIGREKEFFAANNANLLPDVTIDGVECTARLLAVDDLT
jgi:hypothetical protein